MTILMSCRHHRNEPSQRLDDRRQVAAEAVGHLHWLGCWNSTSHPGYPVHRPNRRPPTSSLTAIVGRKMLEKLATVELSVALQ